jgi:hypothetical protein
LVVVPAGQGSQVADCAAWAKVSAGQGVHWAFRPPGEDRPGLQDSWWQSLASVTASQGSTCEACIIAQGVHSRARLAALRSGAKARVAHLICASTGALVGNK